MPKVNLSRLVRDAIKERRHIVDRGYILILYENKVAKKTWTKKSVLKESKFGSLLYSYGTRVPVYFGIIYPDPRFIRSFFDMPIDHHYLVMQRINGRRFHDLDRTEKIDALEQYKNEVSRAARLGVTPENGFDISNCLYEEGKLYLIDFFHWKNSDSIGLEHFLSQLDLFYNNIRDSIKK